MAERAGFEPARNLRLYAISSRARSSTPAPLQHGGATRAGAYHLNGPAPLDDNRHYKDGPSGLSTGSWPTGGFLILPLQLVQRVLYNWLG